jgi:hypothetical protein
MFALPAADGNRRNEYRRTLTARDGTWFTAAVGRHDRWYVDGTTTTAVAISGMRG